MVNMGVGNEDKIKITRTVNLGIRVALLDSLIALMHTAIHSKTPTTGFNNVTRTSHCARGTQKLDFHTFFAGPTGRLSFSKKSGASSDKAQAPTSLSHIHHYFRIPSADILSNKEITILRCQSP